MRPLLLAAAAFGLLLTSGCVLSVTGDGHDSSSSHREIRKQEKHEAQLQAIQKQKNKRLFMWGLLIVGLGAITLGLVKLPKSEENSLPRLAADTIASTDHVKGNPISEVVLIEYSDFQCPACANGARYLKKVMAEHPDMFYLEMKYFQI